MRGTASEPYRNLNSACKALVSIIQDVDAKDYDRAFASRTLVEVEFAKREFRGIPRLSSHSLEAIASARFATAKRSKSSLATSTFTELPDASTGQPEASTPITSTTTEPLK